MKNNAFFLQEKNVTVALLASKEPSDRIVAFNLIKEAKMLNLNFDKSVVENLPFF